MSLSVQILAVGTRMPGWIEAGVAEYSKRIPRGVNLSFLELTGGNRGKGGSAAQAKETEAKLILEKLVGVDCVIALDETGVALTTKRLAAHLEEMQMHSSRLAFVIGGADGLAEQVLARANHIWSLSGLTFPHALVRVILVEQIYRALMINAHHPYHRE